VVGIYRWLTGSHYAIEAVYAPLETVGKLIHHEDFASFALLDASVTTLAEEADYLRQLKQAFEAHDVKLDVYTTLARLEQRQFTRNQFQPVLGTLLGLASMIAVVGGIGLSGTLAIGVLQRQREIGVLRAIGAPPNRIFRLFLLEGLFHGFMAWALSVPLAYWAAEPVARELGMTLFGIRLDYAFDARAVIYWLLIILTVAIAACYVPARNASRLSIRECLGH
jgi:putative ABC transport system permease protein